MWTKRHFQCPECDARPMPRTRPAAALPKCYRFNQVCGIDTMEVRNLLDGKIQSEYHGQASKTQWFFWKENCTDIHLALLRDRQFEEVGTWMAPDKE